MKDEHRRRLPSRGKGLRRKEFYSLHSGPPCTQAVDGVCPHGMWVNVHRQRFSEMIFAIAPKTWQWLVNRKRKIV